MSSSEEQSSQFQPSKVTRFSLLGFKIIEFCLIVICIGLIDDPASSTSNAYKGFIMPRTIGLSYATFGAFIIFTGVYLSMRIFKDTCPWKTSALMSFIGFILFLACASMLFKDWSHAKNWGAWSPNVHRLDFVCATASTATITSVIFLCDLLLTLRFGIKGEIE